VISKVFILKQHTPIIHFQWKEAAQGATLRPTELKAKLDEFIIKREFPGGQVNWLDAGREALFIKDNTRIIRGRRKREGNKYPAHPALDYSVAIRTSKCEYWEADIDKGRSLWPGYFGNQGEQNQKEPKKLVYTSEQIQVRISSTNDEVLELVTKHWCSFWTWTNFGTRQSKGFGSFYPSEEFEPYIGPKELRYFFHVRLRRTNIEQQQKELFGAIDLFYKTLRSGINHNIYFKSLMYEYAKSHGYKWDKRSIKEMFFLTELEKQQLNTDYLDTATKFPLDPHGPLFWDNQNGKKYLWRDLLGFSTLEKWGNRYGPGTVLSKKIIGITRMRSPIFFKPLKLSDSSFVIYFDVLPEYKESLLPDGVGPVSGYKRVNATIQIRQDEKDAGNGVLTMLCGFNYDEYLKFCFKDGFKVVAKQVRSAYHRNSPDANTLAGIYEQLSHCVK